MVVGLTGGYCAGKDVIAQILESRGYTLIDVDEVGHDVLSARAAEVIAAFGSSVCAPDGGVDRKVLGNIVFADPAALARLESLVHPAMIAEVKLKTAAVRGDVLINAAILYHMGLHTLCDVVVCVTAPVVARIFRAMRRDELPFRTVLARIRAQKGICALSNPQFNDSLVDTYTVRNRGSMRSLERRVARLDLRLRG